MSPLERRILWYDGPLDALAAPEGATIAWYLRLDSPLAHREASRAALSPADLADLACRANGELRSMRRRLTKALVGHVLGMHPGAVRIGRSEAGAPLLENVPGWHVSLSGQWPHCLIALSPEPVGVDVEPLTAPSPPDDALTAAERSAVAGDGGEALRRWVVKEAHAKCRGVASRIEPEAIETERLAGDAYAAWSATGRTLCRLRVADGTVQALALGGLG